MTDLSVHFLLFLVHFALWFTTSAYYEMSQPWQWDLYQMHDLWPGDSKTIPRKGLQVFCFKARGKSVVHIWKTLIFSFNIQSDAFDVYEGKSPVDVLEKHEDQLRSWSINLFSTRKKREIRYSPFENACIGIYSHNYNDHPYTVTLSHIRIDLWKVTLLCVGITLFWFAQKLSHNPLFYYISGVTLGVTTSIIVLIYFTSKLLPRGKMMYLLAAGGWTVSIYLAQMLWDNMQLIVVQYREWLIWYIVITSVISFIVCYRFGPVTNQRTKSIIQWFLQVFALMMIYYSSYFREASVGICILLVCTYNFPTVVVHKGKSYWRRVFPKRRKLLTEEEYHEEGVKETGIALEALRTYCASPESNPWKTVLRLRDPIRFAKFMEGQKHLANEEVFQYESETSRLFEENELTDDEGYLLNDSDC